MEKKETESPEKGLVVAVQEATDRLTAWADTHRMIWTNTGDESHKNSLENYCRLAYRLKEGLHAFTNTIESLRFDRDQCARLAIEIKGVNGYGWARQAVGLAQALWYLTRDSDDYLAYTKIWRLACDLGAVVRRAASKGGKHDA